MRPCRKAGDATVAGTLFHVKLRVLIADDEPLARERLRQFLLGETDVEIVAESASGIETLESIRKTSPDLVFLDVHMPEMDGLKVLQRLDAARLPAVIFVTAYDRYAVRAFEAHAVDFLLKPFDRERFRKALNRAREIVRIDRAHRGVETIAKLFAALQERRKEAQCLVVKSAGRYSLIKPDQIDWIRGADNYAELHVENTVHLVRKPLATLEQELPAKQFIRISRSLIVNLDRIKELHSKSHGDYVVVLEDGARLTAGRTYREALHRLLGKPL